MSKITGSNLERFKKSSSVGMSWDLTDFPAQQVSFSKLDGKKDTSMQFIRMTVKVGGADKTFALKYEESLFTKGVLVADKESGELSYTGKQVACVSGKLVA